MVRGGERAEPRRRGRRMRASRGGCLERVGLCMARSQSREVVPRGTWGAPLSRDALSATTRRGRQEASHVGRGPLCCARWKRSCLQEERAQWTSGAARRLCGAPDMGRVPSVTLPLPTPHPFHVKRTGERRCNATLRPGVVSRGTSGVSCPNRSMRFLSRVIPSASTAPPSTSTPTPRRRCPSTGPSRLPEGDRPPRSRHGGE